MSSNSESGHERPSAAAGALPLDFPRHRRERIYVVLAVALLVGISIYLIEREREQTWRSAEGGVLNVALGLQAGTTQTLEHSISSLRHLGVTLGRRAAPPREETLAALREAIALDPVTAYLGLASAADGSLTLVDREGEPASPEIAAALAGLAQWRDPVPALRPLVTLPRRSQPYLPVGLRLSGSGVEGGAAFALVSAQELTAGSESLRLIPDGWASWVMPDGTRLLAYSRASGQMLVNGPQIPTSLMRLTWGRFGTFNALGPVDGLQYLVGYSRSATLPFIVATTSPRSALFWEWARRAVAPAVVLLLGVIAILIFGSRLHVTLLRQGHMLGELQELAGRLLRLQDDERRRIGLELHDSIVQLLAVLEFNLDRLAASDGRHARQRELLEESVDLVHQCSVDLRTTSYLLHPPLLDELGLLSALRWLADGLRQRSDIQMQLELPPSMERLSRELELALFRVAQEALSNVHRHSRSPTVVVRLRTSGETVTLEVEDAGRGILDDASPDGTVALPSLGVGLASMRVRMRQIGGTLTIDTDAQGTCVRAQVPLVRASAPALAPVTAPPPAAEPPVQVRSAAS